MRLLFPILCTLLTLSCRTTSESNKGSDQQPSAVVPANSVWLKKVVGRLTESTPPAQIFECQVTEDRVDSPAQVQEWINAVKAAGLVTSVYIRAHEPSYELYAYLQGEEITVMQNASTRVYPKPDNPDNGKNAAADALIQLADKVCPSPKLDQ